MNACTLKYIELVLTAACIALHQYSYDLTDIATLVLCSGTFIGYLILLSGEIIGDTVDTPMDIVLDMYYSAVGGGLFLSCGTAIFLARLRGVPPDAPPRTGDRSTALALGSCCLLLGAIMLLDLLLAYIDSEDIDEDSIM